MSLQNGSPASSVPGSRHPGQSGVREALIDLGAIRRNIDAVRAQTGCTQVLADVSCDGYGHGALRVARAALEAGVSGFLVARPGEAASLRRAGVSVPIVAWQVQDAAALAEAARERVDVAVDSVQGLDAAARAGVRGVHLALDPTGGELARVEWEALCRAARRGVVPVHGVLARADRPDEASAAFLEEALGILRQEGLQPRFVHLHDVEARARMLAGEDTVRLAATLYGLSADPDGDTADDAWPEPVLTLTAPVVAVKDVGAGEGISYGYTYVTARPTRVLLVPLGYGDGIPRRSGNLARVGVRGVTLPVAGRVAMDALMLDASELLDRGIDPAVGEIATVIGRAGWPARRWARVLDTTSLDIVSRLGPRISRVEA